MEVAPEPEQYSHDTMREEVIVSRKEQVRIKAFAFFAMALDAIALDRAVLSEHNQRLRVVQADFIPRIELCNVG